MNNNREHHKVCDVCGEHDDQNHLSTELHRFNHMLFGFNKCRKKSFPDNKVVVTQKVNLSNTDGIKQDITEKGTLQVKLCPAKFDELNRTLGFKLTITNGGVMPVHVIVNLLHPYSAFELESPLNICLLNEGETFSPVVRFTLREAIMIGSVKIPIGVTIQPQDINKAKDYIVLYREIVLIIKDGNEMEENVNQSPFKKEKWNKVNFVDPNNRPRVLNNYPIPTQLERVIYSGLNILENFTPFERQEIYRIKAILNQGPTIANYAAFFHNLLWIDEASAFIGLSQYNMTNVTVSVIRSTFLELEVPGLAEKRPSVMAGDIINLRAHSDHTAYRGVVDSVNDKTIFIKDINEILLLTLSDDPTIELDVNFQYSRLQHERMHTGVDMCVSNLMLTYLFPIAPLRQKNPMVLHPSSLFNSSIGRNIEQLTAVQNIVSDTSQGAPYIIFGPPGTGKTVTLVEAILQIKKTTTKHILICAPANAACDMLAAKLIEWGCEKKELLRLYTSNRTLADIPPDLKRFSNLEGDDFVGYTGLVLKKTFRIVISTLHLIGKFANDYSPDCVFIDEAAQATEPESDIPIGLLCPGKQIVLAGDPKQLGPVCSSSAMKRGLGTSLLERLMNNNQLYAPTSTNPLRYNQLYLTMLINNYRSPQEMIRIPNELFYGNTLQCLGNHEDPISKIYISKLINGHKQTEDIKGSAAIEFCGMLSKEERKGYSPSYYNEAEIEMVMKYVTSLIGLPNIRVAAKDIGIIAPYIRQVHRIKEEIKRRDLVDIEVGTTESFQGREKRIMIISTVRAQHSLLKYDRKYKLGFVKNSRRFNVAVTRAKSKLIIVGNPFVLCYDKDNWSKYIEYCQDEHAYFGVPFVERTSDVRLQITGMLEGWNHN